MSFTGLPPEAVPALMTGAITPHPALEGRADAYLPSPASRTMPQTSPFCPTAR